MTSMEDEQGLIPAREQYLRAAAEVHDETLAQLHTHLADQTEHVMGRMEEKRGRVSALRAIDLSLAQRHAGVRNDGGAEDLEDLLVTVRQGVFDTMVDVEEDIVDLAEGLASNRTATAALVEDEETRLHQVNANLKALATHRLLLQDDLDQDLVLLNASMETAVLLARQADNVNHTWHFEHSAIQEKMRLVRAAVVAIPLHDTPPP